MSQLEFTAIDAPLVRRAAIVIDRARERGLTLVTAESCTGGLLAAVLSEAPGAGAQLHGGFAVYTKAQKTVALGVPEALLERSTAVCEDVARAMVAGALERSCADVAVAVTGVAGPACDEDGNPVGLVHLAAGRRGAPARHRGFRFGEIGRGAIRYRAVVAALDLVETVLDAIVLDEARGPAAAAADTGPVSRRRPA
ncbi:CinA family protein [Rhodoplanes sp. SY1]|uniref:CinA family protein n=1 Tax=Rhodoplanes sp. SY1 TaxID=3166646 RepID=UPI0038B5F821